MSRPHSYKVQIGEDHLDLIIEEDRLLIDGAPQNLVVDAPDAQTYNIIYNNKSYRLFIESVEDNRCTLLINGRTHVVTVKDARDQLLDQYGIADAAQSLEREIRAPMPGLVLDVLVAEGSEISAGTGLIVLEAMKMENELKAASAGRVASIHVNPGDPVAKNDLLIELDAS